jgi:hypothetical protein
MDRPFGDPAGPARRRHAWPAGLFLCALAGLAGAVLATSAPGCFADRPPMAGFWYEDMSFALPPDATARLGGPLQPEDVESVKRLSRAELERAFAGLRITITGRRDALYRIGVVRTLSNRYPIPGAGQSVGLGPFGGAGSIGFVVAALNAIQHRPPGASRRDVIEGIGRGIGRAAAHELAHQILWPAMRDDRSDETSYEYFTSDRSSQYYGDLHWGRAWPLLQQKLDR